RGGRIGGRVEAATLAADLVPAAGLHRVGLADGRIALGSAVIVGGVQRLGGVGLTAAALQGVLVRRVLARAFRAFPFVGHGRRSFTSRTRRQSVGTAARVPASE